MQQTESISRIMDTNKADFISCSVLASNAFVHTNCKNHPFPLWRRWVVSCLLGGFPTPQERRKICGYAILRIAIYQRSSYPQDLPILIF